MIFEISKLEGNLSGCVFYFDTLSFILVAAWLSLSHVSGAALKSLSIKELTERDSVICVLVCVCVCAGLQCDSLATAPHRRPPSLPQSPCAGGC